MGSSAAAAGWVFAGTLSGTGLGNLLNLVAGPRHLCPIAPIAEVKCEVTCECPVNSFSWLSYGVAALFLLAAWALGFFCGSCCPRAAVKHSLQVKGKGSWGAAPAIAY